MRKGFGGFIDGTRGFIFQVYGITFLIFENGLIYSAFLDIFGVVFRAEGAFYRDIAILDAVCRMMSLVFNVPGLMIVMIMGVAVFLVIV
jgi:hypothetical protein